MDTLANAGNSHYGAVSDVACQWPDTDSDSDLGPDQCQFGDTYFNSFLFDNYIHLIFYKYITITYKTTLFFVQV